MISTSQGWVVDFDGFYVINYEFSKGIKVALINQWLKDVEMWEGIEKNSINEDSIYNNWWFLDYGIYGDVIILNKY